ncbi:MAG: hypothetical protein RBQ71_03040 [Acholeplasmataceae bacterium]|jgi:hypothetical protein|nr:hypothetical protein [Acholeplasmataceae bacterium]
MIASEQRTSMRYLMYFLAGIIIILNIVNYFIATYSDFNMYVSTIMTIAGIIATLMIALLDPKFHRIIAIPLIINFVIGMVLSVAQIRSLYTIFPNIQIIIYVLTTIFSLIASVVHIYIFIKPKMYHLSDLIIFGFLFIHFITNVFRSVFNFIQISMMPNVIGYSFAQLFIGGILAPALSLALLLFYILEAKRLSELENNGELFKHDPDKAKNMAALTKLYRDGHLTWNEYEEKKSMLKNDL